MVAYLQYFAVLEMEWRNATMGNLSFVLQQVPISEEIL